MWTIYFVVAAIALVIFLANKKGPVEGLGRIEPPPERLGKFEGEVVGESHYQEALDHIAGGKTLDGHELIVDARLVFEDDNPHDNKAVQVWIGAEPVGHLPRGVARAFRRDAPPNTRVFLCRARIVGGWRDGRRSGYYGVQLDT